MRCPSCGYQNSENNKFCNQCGKQLSKPAGAEGGELSAAVDFNDLLGDLDDLGMSQGESPLTPSSSGDSEEFSLDGLDLDLGDFGVASPETATPAPSTDLSMDLDFDLGLGDGGSNSSETSLEAPSGGGFSLDSADLDMDDLFSMTGEESPAPPKETARISPEKSPTPTVDELDLNDLFGGDDPVETVKPPEPSPSMETPDLGMDLDFSFDDPTEVSPPADSPSQPPPSMEFDMDGLFDPTEGEGIMGLEKGEKKGPMEKFDKPLEFDLEGISNNEPESNPLESPLDLTLLEESPSSEGGEDFFGDLDLEPAQTAPELVVESQEDISFDLFESPEQPPLTEMADIPSIDLGPTDEETSSGPLEDMTFENFDPQPVPTLKNPPQEEDPFGDIGFSDPDFSPGETIQKEEDPFSQFGMETLDSLENGDSLDNMGNLDNTGKLDPKGFESESPDDEVKILQALGDLPQSPPEMDDDFPQPVQEKPSRSSQPISVQPKVEEHISEEERDELLATVSTIESPMEKSSVEVPLELENMSPDTRLEYLQSELDKAVGDDEKYRVVIDMARYLDKGMKGTLLRLLDEADDIKEIAVEALGRLKSTEAIPRIIQILDQSYIELSYICARSLGEIGDISATQSLIQFIKHPDPDLAYISIEAIGKIGDTGSLNALSDIVKSENPDLRYIVAEALGNLKDEEATSPLLELVKDDVQEVKIRAIKSLGQIASNRSVSHLLICLHDQNLEIKKVAIEALSCIKSPKAVEPLLEIINLVDEEMKKNVIFALGEIGDPSAVENLLLLMNKFPTTLRVVTIETLGKIGSPKATPYLLKSLSDTSLDIKIQALIALGKLKDPAATAEVLKFLEHPEESLRRCAAEALGKIHDEKAAPALIQRLNDPVAEVRLATVHALGTIKNPDSIEALILSLNDFHKEVVERTEWALQEIGEGGVENLISAIEESSPKLGVTLSIIKILGQIGSIRGIAPLIQFKERRGDILDRNITLALCDALVKIDQNLMENRPLSVIIKTGYVWARYSIIKVLYDFNDERAINILLGVVQNTLTSLDIKKLAAIPDKRIFEASLEIKNLIYIKASELFGEIADDQAIPKLMNLFLESNFEIRKWIMESIGRLKSEKAIDALIDIIKNPDYGIPYQEVSKELIKMSAAKIIEKISMAIGHPNGKVRSALVFVLGQLCDERGLSVCEKMQGDKEDKVRLNAIEAIGKIGSSRATGLVVKGLEDKNEAVRRKAAQVLGELKDIAAIEYLAEHIKDGSSLVRKAIVASLEAMDDPRVSQILLGALKDTDPEVRTQAVRVLGCNGNKKLTGDLLDLLSDESPLVREAAVEAVGLLKSTKAVVPLLHMFKDKIPQVQKKVAEVFAKNTSDYYAVLMDALKDDDRNIRESAVEVMVNYADLGIIPSLVVNLEDRNNYLRANSAKILGSLGDHQVVTPLLAVTRDRSPMVRKEVMSALGAIGDVAAIVELKKSLRDQNHEVRQSAGSSLNKILRLHNLQ